MITKLLIAAPALALASAGLVACDDTGRRDTAGISGDLGVTEQEFIDCFADVNPSRDGAPSGERQEANKDILLPCLQAINPSITNEFLDQVMDSYRPEGPMP